MAIKLTIDHFNHNMKDLLKEEFDLFYEALQQEPIVSIRKNPKLPFEENYPVVEWCSEGRYLPERESFTLDPIFHSGAYYVQEASSMFIEQLFKQAIIPQLGDEIAVLDLCAAPGGKSTHISSLIGDKSILVANETISARSKILEQNIIKWGYDNTVVTSSDPRQFGRCGAIFDVVVVDAPCSGEGMFRRVEGAMEQWSPANVELCVARQQRIVADVYDSLKAGGYLIYSTCTFNTKEDEQNVQWIVDNFNVEGVDIEIPESWGVSRSTVSGINCFKFLPHKTAGEGFFVAILRRKEESQEVKAKPAKGYKSRYRKLTSKESVEVSTWLKYRDRLLLLADENNNVWGVNKNFTELFRAIEQNVKILYCGLNFGQLFKNSLKPSHALALYKDLNHLCPVINISKEDALDFLRKKDIDPSQFEQGFNLVCYNSFPIGFIKRVGARCNSQLPKEFRIVKL